MRVLVIDPHPVSASRREPHSLWGANDAASSLAYVPLILPGAEAGWSVEHARSLRRGADLLAASSVDCLILDLRFPVAHAMGFLSYIAQQFPGVARITVVALGDSELAEKAGELSHDVVAMPTPTDMFQAICERTVNALSSHGSHGLLALLPRLGRLPARPGLFQRMQELIGQDAPLSKIGALLDQDVAVTAQLLNLANSAYFSFASPSRSAADAVTRLGLNMTSAVVLGASAMSSLAPEHRQIVEESNTHALDLAIRSTALFGPDDQLFLTAIVHDIGRMATLVLFPEEARRLYRPRPHELLGAPQLHIRSERDVIWHEQALAGVDHTVLGAFLLRMWKIDPVVARATELHHSPWQATPQDDPRAVHYASIVAAFHLLDTDPADEDMPAPLADLVNRIRAAELTDRARR